MKCGLPLLIGLALSSVIHPVSLQADEPPDYREAIKPLLKDRCYACHGALKQEAELRLDTGAAIRRGGDNGPAVNAQSVEGSLLLVRVSEKDELLRMPPEGDPLTPAQIALLRRWIAAGANSPADEQPQRNPLDHWAFQRPVRPPVPVIPDANVDNPIDAFVLQAQSRYSYPPQDAAAKSLLLRRVYLDLIGLPPTQAELQAFLADDSPDAYARVVDRLLASPQYGERWARHWMDIWRYSDWYGRRHVPDVWNSASQIWRWRDWIVRSLNADRGYDRMIREMLAADEICPEDDEACYATGYLIRNWYALNPNDWMRNTVEHTGKAFLGLTFNCAHCHDHKYDPIRQDDYFRLRAFFEPISVRQDRVPGEADPGPFQEYQYSVLRKIQRLGAVRIFDKNPAAPTWFYTGGDERNRVEQRGSIAPGVPEFLSDFLPEIEPVDLPAVAWYPGARPAIRKQLLAEAQAAINQSERRLAEAREKSQQIPEELQAQLAAAEQQYEAARKTAEEAGMPGALAGRQSLLLDASEGRRIVQNPVQQLKSLPNGMRIEFQIRLLSDAHANFQLARDAVKGLTAAYVGFVQGRIVSYQPGTFQEFDAGHYDFAAGQNRFRVSLEIQTDADRCLLTVHSLPDNTPLVTDQPVALNGWNPVGDATKTISFDARTGSRVVIDDVRFSAPATGDSEPVTLLQFDFEDPEFPAEQDVIGKAGWKDSSFGVAPAASIVSEYACNTDLQQSWKQLESARRALRTPALPVQAARAGLEAAKQQLASLESRMAADRARFEGAVGQSDVVELIRTASLQEREAALSQAEAELLQRELALAAAEARPDSDKEREKQLAAARKSLAQAQEKVSKAKAALQNDSLQDTYTAFSPTYPKTSTGRRSALAAWITDSRNPLAARVAVNHVWMRHFHQPLVESVYDFGLNGADPTHPELLDWLAVELMESGWSMKHLHRLIVTSRAYRRASTTKGAESWKAVDPENRLLWRMNTGRMEAEVVRDSLLYCAGQLDLTMGGQELENSESLTTNRRSLYYSTFPEEGGKSPLGELFDGPDALECYRRTRTVVPQQALALTNSDFVHMVSQKIVSNWVQQQDPSLVSDNGRFVQTMFERILSRNPTEKERELCLELSGPDSEAAADTTLATRKRESLVRVLLNHNDFITIR